jgi:hypothetical protein
MTTIQERRRQIERSTAGAYPEHQPNPFSNGTAAELGRRLAACPGEVTVERLLELLARSLVADKDRRAFLAAYYGSPPCVHFVGFRGDEYVRAQRIWGRPDFIHRSNDLRLWLGGELAPHDTVVIANNAQPSKYAFNDSAVM